MLGKYKNVQDLFVEGRVVELPNGQLLWVQALNPFEADDARAAAHTARARIMLAMREHGTDEEVQLRARFTLAGPEGVVEQIADYETNRKLPKLVDEIRYDPEWVERLDMVEQAETTVAREATEAEQELLAEINRAYLVELSRRLEVEREYQVRQLESLNEDALLERFRETWLDRLGTDRMMAEYELTEVYLAARACDAVSVEGVWNHDDCDHRQRVFESKDEARRAPAGMTALIREALVGLNMGATQGKGSGSPTSSSASSPTPSSQEAESTPSTPDATSTAAPGTST